MANKGGVKILAACLLSTALITLIFLVVMRFSQLSCELVVIDPAQLRLSALNNWAKEKPIRSHDKSMLLKLAAYLEFTSDAAGSVGSAPQPHNTWQPPHTNGQVEANQFNKQPVLNAQASQSTWPNNPPPTTGQQQQQHSNPQPSFGPQTSTINQAQPFQQQVVNSQQVAGRLGAQPSQIQSVFAGNSSLATLTTPTPLPKDKERKYLPLELDDVDMKKLDENRYRYTLVMNCATLYVVFVRRPDRVYVQSITLEKLRPRLDGSSSSAGKTSCEVQIPAQGAFSVEVHDGWARYYCDQPLHFGCFYRHPSQPQVNQLLAELHIHSIEFETASNGTKAHHKSHDFLAVRSECSPLP